MQIEARYKFTVSVLGNVPILKIIFKYNNRWFYKKYNLFWSKDFWDSQWMCKYIEVMNVGILRIIQNDVDCFYWCNPDNKIKIIAYILSVFSLETVMKNCVIDIIQKYTENHKSSIELHDSIHYLKNLQTNNWQCTTIDINDDKLNKE